MHASAVLPTPGIPLTARIAIAPPTLAAVVISLSSALWPVKAVVSGGSEKVSEASAGAPARGAK